MSVLVVTWGRDGDGALLDPAEQLSCALLQLSVAGRTCSWCNLVCASRSNLVIHQRTHLGIKPHKCSTCGQCFTEASNLRVHQRTHNGQKPYLCPICGKGSSTASASRVHQRTHSGEKPYSCKVCGKGFAQTGSFNFLFLCCDHCTVVCVPTFFLLACSLVWLSQVT